MFGLLPSKGFPECSVKKFQAVAAWLLTCASFSKFVLYRTAASSGVAIPYPLISLHAIQRLRLPDSPEGSAQVQGLYMQIANPNPPDNTGAEEDEEEDSINLTIVPAAPASEDTETATATTTSTEDAETKQEETTTQSLFAAVSACSNLHPDPVANGEDGDDDDEYDGNEQPGVGSLLQSGSVVMSGAADGGLPPPMDGSSGWITADNLHEYFDEEGNWIGEGEPPSLPGLGPGAGNVHERDDGPTQNGEGGEEDETKWRRLD